MFVLQIIYENSEFILKWYFNTKKNPNCKKWKSYQKMENKKNSSFFIKKNNKKQEYLLTAC